VWKIPFVMAERRETFLQVERHRIVDLGADAGAFEMRAHGVAVRQPHDVLIEDVMPPGWTNRQRDPSVEPVFVEERVVAVGVGAARVRPRVQMRKLDAQHRRLQRVEPEVAADFLVEVLRLGAVIA
jgi:hypothetical protein